METLLISDAYAVVNVYSGISPYGLDERSFAFLPELFSPAVASTESPGKKPALSRRDQHG